MSIPEQCYANKNLLGFANKNNGAPLRFYSNSECQLLGGNWNANGECLKKEGGSFTWDCRFANNITSNRCTYDKNGYKNNIIQYIEQRSTKGGPSYILPECPNNLKYEPGQSPFREGGMRKLPNGLPYGQCFDSTQLATIQKEWTQGSMDNKWNTLFELKQVENNNCDAKALLL